MYYSYVYRLPCLNIHDCLVEETDVRLSVQSKDRWHNKLLNVLNLTLMS